MLRSMPGEAQRTWLVQFYTPWCGRCRKFHDAWSELAAATPGQRSADAELRLARLDAAASPAVIARFGLRGFPAFLLFDGAQFRRYRGELSLAGLQSFVGSGGGSAHPEAVREASAEFAPTTFRADEQTDRQLMTELGPRRAPASPPALARSHADGPPASPRRPLARVGLLPARHPARLLLQPAPLRLRALVRPVRPRSSEAGGGKERGQKEEIRLSRPPRCPRHAAVCLRLMAVIPRNLNVSKLRFRRFTPGARQPTKPSRASRLNVNAAAALLPRPGHTATAHLRHYPPQASRGSPRVARDIAICRHATL